MRSYDLEAIKWLQNKTKVIDQQGVPIILKTIPGDERQGVLDPNELRIIKENQSAPPDETAPEKQPSFEEMVPKIRESMGFPNYNLNTVEIHTKYEELSGSGNIVGLWRYYPRKPEHKTKRPAFIFFHGGGWVGGSVYTVENVCKLLAELADAVVFNVAYSLAPEKPYPNGFNDNYHAVKHVYEHAESYGIDANKICIGGDSAGGNFAAAISLRAKEEKGPKIAMQVLIYPALLRADASVAGYVWNEAVFDKSEEHRDIIKGCIGLGKPVNYEEDVFLKAYVSDPERVNDPYVSPILAPSHEGLPKTILAGAEFDGLRIQTEFYAKQLIEAGVETTVFRYNGTTHAFIDKLGHVPQAEDLCIEIAKAMKQL